MAAENKRPDTADTGSVRGRVVSREEWQQRQLAFARIIIKAMVIFSA